MYAHMLPRPELMLAYNNEGVPAWEAACADARSTRVAAPLGEARAADDLAGDGRTLVLAAFDAVARAARRPSRSSSATASRAADLTFACLAASVVLPPEYGVALPAAGRCCPTTSRDDVERFRAHPAGAYALELFRELRYSPSRRLNQRFAQRAAS